jgi:ABC-type spermidine/putrescine transport system permease subunit II
MIPSVRSRLSAAAVAFVLGFAVANYGLFRVPPPDQWLWVGAAAVLMGTSAWGVIVADSRRRLSVWAVLGVELFVVVTLVPMLWIVTLALSGSTQPSGLWPESFDTSAFGTAWDDEGIRSAASTSVAAAVLATAVAILPALALAIVLARSRWRARRAVHAFVLLVVLSPLVVAAVGIGDLAVTLGVSDTTVTVAVAQLVITLPLLTWAFTSVLATAPWTLADAARVDGASRTAVLRRVLLPTVGPGMLVAVALVAVVALQDFALASSVTGAGDARTLPVELLQRLSGAVDAGAGSNVTAPDGPSAAGTAVVAAVGLMALVPAAVLALVGPRTLTRLMGRSYR